MGSAPDIVGEGVADEFRSCLDSGPAIPFDNVRTTIERAGPAPARLFADIDERPLAAASIAAVHRARLHDGTEVAVRCCGPGWSRWSRPTWPYLGAGAVGGAAGRRPGDGSALVPHPGCASGGEELDLRNEARSMQAFRQVLTELGLDLIVVPQVYERQYSSKRVLTMELLHGVLSTTSTTSSAWGTAHGRWCAACRRGS